MSDWLVFVPRDGDGSLPFMINYLANKKLSMWANILACPLGGEVSYDRKRSFRKQPYLTFYGQLKIRSDNGLPPTDLKALNDGQNLYDCVYEWCSDIRQLLDNPEVREYEQEEVKEFKQWYDKHFDPFNQTVHEEPEWGNNKWYMKKALNECDFVGEMHELGEKLKTEAVPPEEKKPAPENTAPPQKEYKSKRKGWIIEQSNRGKSPQEIKAAWNALSAKERKEIDSTYNKKIENVQTIRNTINAV
jgi:hypothetical protein